MARADIAVRSATRYSPKSVVPLLTGLASRGYIVRDSNSVRVKLAEAPKCYYEREHPISSTWQSRSYNGLRQLGQKGGALKAELSIPSPEQEVRIVPCGDKGQGTRAL